MGGIGYLNLLHPREGSIKKACRSSPNAQSLAMNAPQEP